LLLVSVAITTVVSNITGSLKGPLASVLAQSSLIHAISLTASFAFVAVLFTMIYRFLPYAKMPWRSIWFGAIVGSVFFAIGKLVLGFYLAQVATTSVYGTAASIVALMMWNYYSVQIFLYGAELTKAHARTASHPNGE
jgi:membrane protein